MFFSRLKTHVFDLARLATPVVAARSGVMVMALVDTVMVGRYSARELAYLGIGLAPVIPLLLTMLGLVMGTLVLTASAFGGGRYQDCGAVWRRSLPYALCLGAVAAVICLFGEMLMRLLGQNPDLSKAAGPIVTVLGLGIAPQLLFVTSTFFLEGIREPVPGMIAMLAANILNAALNWILVYGHWGVPPLGAMGSAWATTLVRWALGIGFAAYVWLMADHARFGVRLKPLGGWRSWAQQRRLGLATGASIGIEATAFAAMNVFAGWLGPYPLAAYTIAINMLAMMYMVAIGIGSATAVRVGIAHGRGDARETSWAGWTGLGVCTVAMTAMGVLIAVFPDAIVSAYTIDPALSAVTIPVVALCAWVLVADGGQGVMANALRGRGETWVATGLHAVSYIVIMMPLAWLLAFPGGRGVLGLYEGILIASVVSLVFLAGRFYWLGWRDCTYLLIEKNR